jgi:molecular chaperone HscB
MKYFELFAIPVQFDVDLDLINARYLELQKILHPDRHASFGAQEQLVAVQKTAELNDALQVLKQPLKRAEYMLAEKNIDIRGEQQTLQDPEFLMQQMELREELSEITDAADPEEAIETFEKHVKSLYQDYYQELKQYIDSNEESVLLNAADIVRKLKFIYKLREEIERIEDALFDD